MRKRTASVTVCFILLVSCFMTVKADGPAIEPYSSTIFSNYIASATCQMCIRDRYLARLNGSSES